MHDFFCPPDEKCINTSAVRMYLYDTAENKPVVMSESLLSGRPVVVENPTMQPVVFRPIDKVVYGSDDPRRGDVFLHTKDRIQLYFVELKLWHVAGWFKDGLEQLKNVVLDFISSHRDVFISAVVRRAYICNPYRPRFAYSHAEDIRDFHRMTRFALYPEGCVRIEGSAREGGGL